MVLSRDDVLKHSEVVTERLEVPEWGGEVIVRGMTGRERDSWEASMFEQRGKKMIANPDNVRAKLVARCVIDEDGRRLFMDSDTDALGGLSAAPISRIYDVAARLSGVTEEDVEEMMRDFGKTPGGDSSSGSPTTTGSPSDGYSETPTHSS
jgi:hypothetical protein